MFAKLEEKLYVVLKFITFLLMLAMVAIIFSQVIARYAFSNSLSWSEEIGRHIFIWMTFLGAALAVRSRSHVALDLLVKAFPQKLQKVILVFGYLVMIVFAGVLVYAGIKMMTLGARQMSAAVQIPMKYIYIVLPISGILMIFYLLKNLCEDITRG
ncbi:MAG: TRAP transporter small permease [Veillonellales bacterium]